MRKLFLFSVLIAALSVFVSCQKQQTEEEKNAEVERKVQERLAAERQTQEIAQRQADLDAREKALADKQNAAALPAENSEREEQQTTGESRTRSREPRERSINVVYSTFYNKLEPYGDWIGTNDYGYVFHPRQAESSRTWRPYTNGRWVYTDAGWTWISEEPFGWATYHYGRWTRLHGIGWVWVPGNQWAPAWVSWRKSSDYVGWAPLPPEARFDQHTGIHNWSDSYYDVGPDQYCFVASREFGAPRVEQTLLPPERNVTIINQTTNVTNITYNNTTIVNEGPNYEELRSTRRAPVQRCRLERNANVDFASEPQRGEVRGETVVIAAPVIAQPVANERPQTVKQTIATAAIDLGWAAIANQDDMKKTRQKMKSEATPPPNAPSKQFVKTESRSGATTQSAGTPIATSPSASATAAPSSTATATATAIPTMTPHRAATAAPSASASPVTSSSPSQRRGRLLVPSPTASPKVESTATPRATASNSPAPVDTVPATAITPPPQGAPLVPVKSPPEDGKGKFKSQAQHYQPPTKVQPMPSVSPSASPTSTSSPSAAESPTASAEKMTKHEKKEQKREEKQELKRERKAGNAPTSPTATP